MSKARIEFINGRTLNVECIIDVYPMANDAVGFEIEGCKKVVVPLQNVEYIIFGDDEENEVEANDEKLKQQNAKLKRLLAKAMKALNDVGSCVNCINEAEAPYCSICVWKWKHAAEAEKLLGGGESNDRE